MKISIGDEAISIKGTKGKITDIYIMYANTPYPETWMIINWENGRVSENTLENIMTGCTFKCKEK